jgi:hypothetical protein
MDSKEESRESRLRREAAHFGIRMLKSSGARSLDNHRGYKLVEASRNAVVLGSRFDAGLDDVETFLAARSSNDYY